MNKQSDDVVQHGGSAPPRELEARREIEARGSLWRAIEMGRELYESLPHEARAELHLRRRKLVSMRKLAAARGTPVSTLWRSLAIYLLHRRHPEIERYSHVGVCHVSVVLGVPDEQQLFLLRRTEQARWSRQQLQRFIKTRLPRKPSAPGAGEIELRVAAPSGDGCHRASAAFQPTGDAA
jgi:hypothetical protein